MSPTSNKKDSMGDRMKRYEEAHQFILTPRTSVIIRVDGKAFHTFTRGCDKPFDADLEDAMIQSTTQTFNRIQGAKLAYTQSDEASFWITDFDDINTSGWLGYNYSKIISITASMFTSYFVQSYGFQRMHDAHKLKVSPSFDARAFNIPDSDVANYFLWRAKDWKRNSLFMYARSFFSHSQLDKKKQEDVHELLHTIGKNWATDLSDIQKNGCFIRRNLESTGEFDKTIKHYDIFPNYESVNGLVEKCFPVDKESKND